MLGSKTALRGFVLGRLVRMGAQEVADHEMAELFGAFALAHVQVVGAWALGRTSEEEISGQLGIGDEQVAEPSQRVRISLDWPQADHRQLEIEDWLGGKIGD